MIQTDPSHVLKLHIYNRPCQHPEFKHFGGSVEIPGSSPIPVTILVCANCGQQVVIPVILNALQAAVVLNACQGQAE